MDNVKRLRRRYFIKGGVQTRFIRLNVLLAVLVSILISTSIYQLSKEMLGGKLEEVYPSGLLKNIYGAVDKALVMRLLFIIPVVIISTVFVSHKLAGPIYHIERVLGAIAEGHFTERIHLRPHDELKEIAVRINKTLDLIGQNGNIVEKHLEEIEKLFGELQRLEADSSRRQEISEKLSSSMKSIRETLSHLKTT